MVFAHAIVVVLELYRSPEPYLLNMQLLDRAPLWRRLYRQQRVCYDDGHEKYVADDRLIFL